MNGVNRKDPDMNEILREQEEYYDRLAPHYEEWTRSFTDRPVLIDSKKKWQMSWQSCAKHANYFSSRCTRLLEIGCGTSRLDSAQENALILLDTSMRMLLQAQRKHSVGKRYFVQGRGQALPFKDGVFDGIVCIGLLSHFPHDVCRTILNEICRTLQNSGSLFVADSMKAFPGKSQVTGIQLRKDFFQEKIYRVFKLYRQPEEIIEMFPAGRISFKQKEDFVFMMTWDKGAD